MIEIIGNKCIFVKRSSIGASRETVMLERSEASGAGTILFQKLSFLLVSRFPLIDVVFWISISSTRKRNKSWLAADGKNIP
jgi:hypothetical protein